MRVAAIVSVFGVLAASGCASGDTAKFSVTSEPPGCQVDVNGVMMGTTPCEVLLSYSERWVGLAFAPGGWAKGNESYRVECFPPRTGGEGLISQMKVIVPAQTPNGGALHFDLRLDPIKPRERIDVRSVQ